MYTFAAIIDLNDAYVIVVTFIFNNFLGADPTLRDAEGCSCLHLAAQFGHTALVAYLVARGVSPDLGDRGGMTALMWSSWKVYRNAFVIEG